MTRLELFKTFSASPAKAMQTHKESMQKIFLNSKCTKFAKCFHLGRVIHSLHRSIFTT